MPTILFEYDANISKSCSPFDQLFILISNLYFSSFFKFCHIKLILLIYSLKVSFVIRDAEEKRHRNGINALQLDPMLNRLYSAGKLFCSLFI